MMLEKRITRCLSSFIERLQGIKVMKKLILIIIIFDETFHFSHRSRAHLQSEKRYAQGSIKMMFNGIKVLNTSKYIGEAINKFH